MAQPIPLPAPAATTSTLEMVTPDVARDWLAQNIHNRNVRRAVVATYARDMRQGRWQYTAEPIKFAADGVLLDGQHRLHAIVQSGASIPMLVVRGLRLAAQSAMDTGARRTASDALGLSGEKATGVLAAAAKLIITDMGRAERPVSTGEIAELLESEPFLRTICAEILPTLRVMGVTPAVLAYCYWRLSAIDSSRCSVFFESLSTLAGLPAGSPILALNRRLNDSAGRRSVRSRMYRIETIACIFMAWNAWVKGESRTIIKLALRQDGRIAVPEPRQP